MVVSKTRLEHFKMRCRGCSHRGTPGLVDFDKRFFICSYMILPTADMPPAADMSNMHSSAATEDDDDDDDEDAAWRVFCITAFLENHIVPKLGKFLHGRIPVSFNIAASQ